MKDSEIAVGLDIGTTKIVAIIGRKNVHGKIEILGIGKAKSLGVQRGVVHNIVRTMESIQLAVEEAESTSGQKIKQVVVGIAGQHIRSQHHAEYIDRDNYEEVITEEDIDSLIAQVHRMKMRPGEEIIDVLPQEFKIDEKNGIIEPVGMSGRRIESNFHVVIGNVSSIRDIGRCVKNSGMELDDIALEPIASADAVLSEEEKEAGVVLIDIGGGTTDLAIFKDGIIRHSAVIPFGGETITKDIREGCSILEKQAELLKVKFGSAVPSENSENEVISIPGLRGREPKEVTKKNLSRIINARIIEIIEQVYLEIRNYGHDEASRKTLIGGLVLTGGGAELKHIKQLVEYITGMDTRIGYPIEYLVSGSDERLESPIYSTSVGLLMKGLSNIEVRKINEEKKRLKESKKAEELEQNKKLEEVLQEKKTKKKPWEVFVDRLRNFLENE